VLISPLLYEQLFRTKSVFRSFIYLQFYLIFWQNNFGEKAACKILVKLITGRARARPTFAKLSGMDDSSKHDFFHGHLQFPVSAERQKIPTLLAIQIAEFHVIVDPKLYEWALYTTTTNLPSKSSVVNFDMMTASDTGAVRKGDNKSLRTGTSDRDTRKLGFYFTSAQFTFF